MFKDNFAIFRNSSFIGVKKVGKDKTYGFIYELKVINH